MSITVIKKDCKVEDAADTSLPYTAYLVEYKKDGESHYDLAMSAKQTDLFDHYYDAYKKDFVTFKQSEGRVSPNLWQNPTQAKKPKKRGRQ
tara:strand:- start:6723 stop:6995 length:273 start_codon:yes stop_codon:yes gene_type:complete